MGTSVPVTRNVSNKRPNCFDSDQENVDIVDASGDHKYSRPTTSKKQKVNMDEVCLETLSVLKDIKNIINNRLGELVDVVKEFAKHK